MFYVTLQMQGAPQSMTEKKGKGLACWNTVFK